jgi:hypothetical protein
MTDGLSTGNVHSISEVVNHAKTAGVSVSECTPETHSHSGRSGLFMPALAAIASDTGGLYVVPKGEDYREGRQTSPVSKKNLNKAIEQIFGKLRR